MGFYQMTRSHATCNYVLIRNKMHSFADDLSYGGGFLDNFGLELIMILVFNSWSCNVVEIAIFMLADFVAFQSQVLVINDSDESLTDANAKRLTTTHRNDSGSMSAMDNGRGSLEISWGFGLEKGRRTAMEDAIYLQWDGKMMGRWRKILSWFVILACLI